MTIQEVNNFFGDMDLFLMDLILKGKIPEGSKVLDVGCGEGRNAVYFLQNSFEYHGWDTDASKLKLISYLANSMKIAGAHFVECDFLTVKPTHKFDLVICSRLLHFSQSEKQFFEMWDKLKSFLKKGGILYITMDSLVGTNIGKPLENGQYEFPDTKVRFALTDKLYNAIKKGFDEVEPLRTVVHHHERAQSFLCLKKR
ncbi:class I SAM-dependent methyltransferase [Ekhidna sp.]|uniref:class I SAM-dependent methyltransferase n=1 Tax=Ekhidna sp. TaxID=2608089 RepID=UPI003296F060